MNKADATEIERNWLDLLLMGLIAVGVGLRVLLSTTRRYQVDEVEHVHAAFLVREGAMPYRDFLEVHTPALHFLLRPFIVGDDPGLTFGLARSVMLLPGLATLALVFVVGRRIWSQRVGLCGAALLAWHTTFAERGMEVRPDAWIAVTTMAALAAELSDGSRTRRAALSGLCVGVGLAFSQKAVFMLAGFGLLWVWRAVRDRELGPLLVSVVASVVPLTLFGLWFASLGAGEEFWNRVIWHPARAFLEQGDTVATRAFAPWEFLGRESMRNLVFVGATLIGVVALYRRGRDEPGVRERVTVVAAIQLCVLAYLVANPYPYPYLHVAVVPAWAVLAGAGFSHAGASVRRASVRHALAAVAWVMVAASFVPRILAKAADTSEYQIALMEEVSNITEPGDAVFDAVGLYLRPSAAYMFFMPEGIAAEYRAGIYPRLADDLRERQAVVVMHNYRTAAYLPSRDYGFLATHFVHYLGNIFVLGSAFQGVAPGEAVLFEVLKTKRFRFTGPPGALEVDGGVFTEGELTRGKHRVTVRAPLRGAVLIMDPPGEPAPGVPPQTIYVNFD